MLQNWFRTLRWVLGIAAVFGMILLWAMLIMLIGAHSAVLAVVVALASFTFALSLCLDEV